MKGKEIIVLTMAVISGFISWVIGNKSGMVACMGFAIILCLVCAFSRRKENDKNV